MKTTFRKTAGYGLITLLALAIGFSACKKDKEPVVPEVTLPVLTTNAITENVGAVVDAAGLIVYPNAKTGGTITSDGGSEITESGICWSTTNEAPTPQDNKIVTNPLTKTGNFTLKIPNLLPATKYYVRAYAINAKGTSYGNAQTFTTVGVADKSGNVYNTIVIGTQTWMLENLKTTKYDDGSDIPMVGAAGWANLATDAMCWYNADVMNKDIYGALYNWYAVNNAVAAKKLAPNGWHIPTLVDWQTLVGNSPSTAAEKLKETGNNHWTIFNGVTASNSTGFTVLAAGFRPAGGDGFASLKEMAAFWIAGEDADSKISYIYLSYNSFAVSFVQAQSTKNLGLSVRCIKN